MTELREKERILTSFYFNLRSLLKLDYLVIIIITFTLFILALIFKTKISSWIHGYIGPFESPFYNYTWTDISEKTNIWYFEIYYDASYYYTTYLDAFSSWWNPYKRYEGPLDYYLYGPMFIYGLYFTYLLLHLSFPGFSQDFLIKNAVKWTAINFDGLSVVLIYLIIINLSSLKETKIKKHLLGFIGAFAYIFMPINLLYVDAYYLNIPQMTFFALLTIWLFMKEKYKLSAYSLSIAWLTKQMPLFILIPLFSFIWKKYDIKKAFNRFLRPFFVSFLILSIPWIFITPHLYLGRIFAAGRPLWYVDNENGVSHGVTFANTFQFFNIKWLAQFFLWINIVMIPFIIFYGFSLFLGHFNAKKIKSDESMFIYYITWVFFIVHTFISRGIFKYYDAFLNPFLVLTCICLISNLVDKFQNYLLKRKKNEYLQLKNPTRKNSREIWWFIAKICLIFIVIVGIYGVNWSIIISIRFVHPLLLFNVLILISLLIPISYYKEVFRKENYKNLKVDIKEFFSYIKNSIKQFFQRIRSSLRKQTE